MNARLPFIAIFLLVVAATAFQAGRASVAVAAGPERAGVARAPREGLSGDRTPPPASLEEVIRNIASVSSRDAYLTMKGASTEAFEAAIRQLEAIPIAPQRSGAIAAFFKVLMQVNPAEAKRLLQQLTEENRWTAIYAIKNAAPPRAMQQVVEVLSQQERSRLAGCGFDHMRDAMDEWSRTDPTAAQRFIEEHPESELDFYTPVVVRNLAAYDPEAARALLVQEIEKANATPASEDNPGQAANFAAYIVARWAEGFFEHDPVAAVEYLVANSSEPTIADAIPSVARMLFKESPDEARAFIMRLPEELRGGAIATAGWVAEHQKYGDADDAIRSPEFIAEWMLKFPDETWSEGIAPVVLQWRMKDRPTLFAWMASLPSDAQSEVAAAYQPHLVDEEADAEIGALMNIPDTALRDQLLEQIMVKAGSARPQVLALLAAAPLAQAQKDRLAGLIPTDWYQPAEVSPDE